VRIRKTAKMHTTLAEVLIASAPAPANGAAPDITTEHAEALQMYGQFVGSWSVEFIDYLDDGTQHPGRGEWHWAWVLGGRAIQDVWIAPPRAERPAALDTAFKNRYGSTIRSYDATRQQWYITWNNPPSGDHLDLIARARVSRSGGAGAGAADIIQEGQMPDGTLKRWSFRDITHDSFRWTGEASHDGGRSWRTEQEMWARRAA